MTETPPPYKPCGYDGTPYVEPRTEGLTTAGRLAKIEYRLFHIEQHIDVLLNYLDPMPVGKHVERPEEV